MLTLIVTSVVVLYAIASMAYVARSEQRATRHRRRDRATTEPAPAAVTSFVATRVTMPAWLQAEPEPAFPEFIRAGPVEYEPSGFWYRVRSSALLVALLTIVGAVVAALLGVAVVVAVLALKNAAG